MKICLVCSSGGHLTEMMQLKDAFEGHELFLITWNEKFTKTLGDSYNIKTYLLLEFKSIKGWFQFLELMVLTTLKEFVILIKEPPDVIVSTGAEIAIPISYMGKILGKKIIYIESLARVNDISGTGKLIYPIADLFLVQWKKLANRYKKARFEGSVI